MYVGRWVGVSVCTGVVESQREKGTEEDKDEENQCRVGTGSTVSLL